MSSFDSPDNRGNSDAHDMLCDSCFYLKTIGAAATVPRSRDYIHDTLSRTVGTDFSAFENSSKYVGCL